MLRQLFFAGLLLLGAGTAEAQKNCRKGIPCGNSCISASKTCRIGTSAPRPSVSATAPAQPGEASASSGAWVGSSRGSTYYRAGCSSARKLSARNLVYFRSEEQATAAGYRRSVQKGC